MNVLIKLLSWLCEISIFRNSGKIINKNIFKIIKKSNFSENEIYMKENCQCVNLYKIEMQLSHKTHYRHRTVPPDCKLLPAITG